jgi:uncharacterized membrane protein
MEPNPSDSLEEQIGELRSRVDRLEEALQSHGVVLQQGEVRRVTDPAAQSPLSPLLSAPVPELKRQVEQPPAIAESPLARPIFAFTSPAASADERSLESRIGSQWFNRVGILAVLIGMAWFLKLAIDNHWIGPLGRVLIGLVAGAGLIAWSERFRSHGYRIVSFLGLGALLLGVSFAYQRDWLNLRGRESKDGPEGQDRQNA